MSTYVPEKITVAVDFLLFTIEEDKLKVLMVQREDGPFEGKLALPGVAVKEQETLAQAAKRCLEEETGITDEVYLEQLYTWGDDCERDPRGRVISVSYIALIPRENIKEKVGVRVIDVSFVDVEELLLSDTEIAFDHRKILEYARERIRNKAEYTQIAFHFLPEEFTLPELQRIYEILLGKELFKANFRKSIKDYVEETDKMRKDGAYRPSKVYRRKTEVFM